VCVWQGTAGHPNGLPPGWDVLRMKATTPQSRPNHSTCFCVLVSCVGVIALHCVVIVIGLVLCRMLRYEKGRPIGWVNGGFGR
jgi:hypothetical protein